MKSLPLLAALLLALALPASAQVADSPPTPPRPLTSDLSSPPPDLGPRTSDLGSPPLNPEPFILERASAETAVVVPHKSTGRKIAEALRDRGVSADLTIAAISTLPIVELRGA
ncbi:MAG: hypothetical protein PHU50_09210, partial [Kiritimatiellae bacterium]|nr:hypothetical protein [Kiritimatiellia bacterium]